MAELFSSGRIVDLILAMMIVEALVLYGVVRATGLAVPLRGLLLNLAAGACLLLALRAVLTGAAWPVAAVWLTLALATHLGDLGQRMRRPR
ncbi:hypothetical protein HFP89_06820 [Wenzhouxiangella sp. XN79A]|uniref:hypothetical protein n=1 Tax=Wenzhouxiangella sp. XN79A TaxID=2724193 RepID=UPI00144A9B12|nr:hypothetical protein [Wenzhouxiangella sp. XN79A]NKI34872.1 hypothetical protein [Wenzhouxiangella sp. XN79A]